MKIYYLTYPSNKPWASDFTGENLRKYSLNEVIPIKIKESRLKTDLKDCINGIIHLHNIQIIRYIKIEKIKKRNIALIGGIRGKIGFHQYKNRLNEFDALAVNIDSSLQYETLKYSKKIYTIPEGVDSDIFKPTSYMIPPGIDINKFKPLNKKPKEFTIAWVGSDHKSFKNADLIKKMGVPYRKATYKKYIPHEEMPLFYNSCDALVNFSEHEGFCLPILEASACGLSIVTSNVGVAKWIIQPRWIVNGNPRDNIEKFRDKIHVLKDDSELAFETGQWNFSQAIKFDWRNITPIYDAMWRAFY
ncbi:MAG: glycosyltransferase family 4 protein [Candidatus Hodarchaeota archaeon]